MLFFSASYLIFLVITFLIYYSVNNKFKHYILFGASIFFISVLSVKVVLFSLIFTTLNYFSGLLLEKYRENAGLKKKLFWLVISIDIGFLAFFKYINFLFENLNAFFSITQFPIEIPYLSLIVPIGISYYTFQSIGYLIRINRGSEVAERNYMRFATFLLFFPKFLSGPVERSNHFFPQIRNLGSFNRDAVSQGLRLFLWGAFKKIVIANNLYEPISIVYNDVQSYTGLPLITVLFLQTIYIYVEFSGYTDMALGSAKIFGIDIIDNFNRPLLARNVSEFWKRWHISLSSWCNDFIFNPFIVKYRKMGNMAAVLGIFLTFFIIGIWHGAQWTFIVLGILQGIAIVYEFYTKRIRLKVGGMLPRSLVNALSRFFTYLFISISLVFFFSNSMADAWYFLSHLFSKINFVFSGYAIIQDKSKFILAFSCFALLFIAEMLNERDKDLLKIFLEQPRWVRWTGYYTCIMIIYFLNSEIASFVYMKF